MALGQGSWRREAPPCHFLVNAARDNIHGLPFSGE